MARIIATIIGSAGRQLPIAETGPDRVTQDELVRLFAAELGR